MVATAGVLLVHEVAGVVASLRKVTLPVHTVSVPDIAAGAAFTDTVTVFLQLRPVV
jgi:hypothetical protein